MNPLSTLSKTFLTSSFGLALILVATTTSSFAQSSGEIEKTLADFFSSDANARMIMNARSQKFDANDKPVRGRSLFSAQEVKDKSFISKKNQMRDNIYKLTKEGVRVSVKDLALQGRAEIESNDGAADLVDNADQIVTNLATMETMKLKSAKLAETPWSDTYWPLYQGTTSQRYNDPSFPAAENWKVNFDYVSRNPVVSNTDFLSPAEKYDLLVGDSAKTYTKAQWTEGQQYFAESGKVATWMGICHGWAPASFMLARPTGAVSVTAADGVSKINFYPSDIKALSSSLWASAQTESKFIGGRCETKNPPQTPAGRVKDRDCFDSNPGAWHMAVVNQIGISKRSFVVDVTYDDEVWNQPSYGYKYTYFNPRTKRAAAKLATAMVPMSEFTNDKFKEFRNSPDAVSVVGVSMEFSYIVETNPSASPTDSPAADAVQKVRYMYDLELDAEGNIVGGEWYTNMHPDFMWVPALNARAVSNADRFATGDWDASSGAPVPASYQKAARAASRTGMPLANVVESLIEAARK